MSEQLYTAFCQQKGGGGTIWIDRVAAPNIEQAIEQACTLCAADWSCSPDSVHCLGLAQGDVTITYWDDQGDD